MHSLWCGRSVRVLVLPLLALPAQAQPPPCTGVAPSGVRQPAYKPATGPARCEGFYERNVSQPFVELVSLTRSAPGTLAADAQGQLRLRGPQQRDLVLTVQPMRSTPLYRMDAALARGATLTWSPQPMLQATGLRLRDLGLLALDPAERDTPAWAPVLARAADDAANAHAVLRPSVAVSALAWRSWRPGTAPGPWREIAGPPLFAWERIALAIPLAGDGRGQRIDVRALDAQGQPLPMLQFRLIGDQDGPP
jgi:hypothetical protein